MPPALPDGRTGGFRRLCVLDEAATKTFSTVPEDHGNCSVGSVTHGLIPCPRPLPARRGRAPRRRMGDRGHVSPDPAVSERPGAITTDARRGIADPDVVLLRLNAKQLMVLSDALPGLRVEGKPQCHIVAVAKEQGEVAASVGCALSRARTGMPATEMTCAIPSARSTT